MIRHPSAAPSFAVREAAPDLPLLFGNVGAVQLNYGVDAAAIQAAIDAVQADVLNLHLNALQEAIQPEGDTRFTGLSQAIRDLVPQLSVPVVAKEVGAGISVKTAHKLADLPLAGVEVAGTGGTSWAAVEAYRAGGDSKRAGAGIRLAGFGVPTVQSLQITRRILANRVVIASGGVRTGMDIAVALAMGADLVALAKPLLEAAQVSYEAAVEALESLVFDLRVICFCTGASSLEELRQVRVIDVTRGYDRA